jgi:hypothetical protein
MFLDTFRSGGFSELFLTVLGSSSGYGRLPLLSLLTLPMYGILGNGTEAAHLVLLLFVPLLVFAVYGIARRLGGERAGQAACVATATLPHMIGLSRQFFVEFPLAAVVTTTVYLFLRLREEQSMRLYGGLALVVAGGLMLKVTYLLFVGPCWLIVALESLRKGQKKFAALVLASGAGLAFALIWYIPNWHRVLWDLQESGFGIEAAPYDYGGPGFLLLRLALSGISLYYTALLVALAWKHRGTCLSRWRGEVKPELLICLAWVAVPLLVLLISVGRDPRYFLPSLPAVAVGIGLLLDSGRDYRRTLLAPFALPVAAMLVVSIVPPTIFSRPWRETMIPLYRVLGMSFHNPPLERRDWRTDGIVELVWRVGQGSTHPLRTVVLANSPQFHFQLFNYVARLQGKRMVFTTCEDTTKPFSVDRCLRRVVLPADFLLDKTGLRKVSGPDRYRAHVDRWMNARCLPFRPVTAGVRLPDGSQVQLWKKAGSPERRDPCPDLTKVVEKPVESEQSQMPIFPEIKVEPNQTEQGE